MFSRMSKANVTSSRRWLITVAALGLTALMVGNLTASERLFGERPERGAAWLPDNYRAVYAAASTGDPIGDELVANAPFDIVGLTAETVGSSLLVTVSFNGAVSPPGTGAPNAVDAFIDIDADQDGNTGEVAWTDFLRDLDPADGTGLGIEFYVDLFQFDETDGTVVLRNDSTDTDAGRVPVSFSGNAFTVQVPLGLIGGDGDVNVAAVVYQDVLDAIDVVPNQGFVEATPGQGGGGILIDTGDTSACVDGPMTLCLTGDRFEVTVDFTTQDGTREGSRINLDATDTGLFWFFEEDNVELVVKVLDACVIPENLGGDRFWVFAGGLTNVETVIRVRDTETGLARIYDNPANTPFQPVQDTAAFDTCP